MGKVKVRWMVSATSTVLCDGITHVRIDCRDNGRHFVNSCGKPMSYSDSLLAMRDAVNIELSACEAEENKVFGEAQTKRRYRVTNGANGLFARMADITDDVAGYAVAGLMFVEEAEASRFNRAEAQVVQMMCELHAERFKIVAWQGNFRIEEVRA